MRTNEAIASSGIFGLRTSLCRGKCLDGTRIEASCRKNSSTNAKWIAHWPYLLRQSVSDEHGLSWDSLHSHFDCALRPESRTRTLPIGLLVRMRLYGGGFYKRNALNPSVFKIPKELWLTTLTLAWRSDLCSARASLRSSYPTLTSVKASLKSSPNLFFRDLTLHPWSLNK